MPPEAGASVGAKALNLAALMRTRLPVPDGFVVTAEAYRAHISALSLGGIPRSRLAAVRETIIKSELARDMAADIRAAFKRLRTPLIAVRSSGTAEDLPGHSFAGLYDTHLRSTDAGGCVRLVKQCWASLWTERAFDYREKNGFEHDKAAMAVVVQQLVVADAAGVVFTADPVTGNTERIIVESCWGLGETLVSGKVTPDRFVLSRRNQRVVERSVSIKSIESALSPTRAIVERRVSSPRAAQPSISDAVARKVALLALKVERVFGTPQDIEWALAGPNLFIVQSRPITTLTPPRTWEDRQVWSSSNTAEVLPGVLTPLVWSTLGAYIHAILGGVFIRLGISFGEHPFIGEVAGRIYTNLNTFTGMVRRMPFANRMSQKQMFGGAALSAQDRARLELSDDDVPDIDSSPLRTLVRLPGFLLWLSRHSPARGRRWMAELRATCERPASLDLSACSLGELAARVRTTLDQIWSGSEGMGYALVGMMYTTVLYDLCRRWLKDPSGSLASRLLAGTGELQSAQAGLELWRLARYVAASAEVKSAVLSREPWTSVRRQLTTTTSGQDFLGRWDRFMQLCGHHARGEMDMMQPRWSETPDYILSTVRSYLSADEHTDPEADITRRARERDLLTAELLDRLRDPLRRALFRCVLRRAQFSAGIRENLKDAVIRILARARVVVVELGRRLAVQGILAAADDVFFIEYDELEPVALGTAGFDVRARTAERRAAYERNQNLDPPAIVIGRYDPRKHMPDTFDPSARVLTGLAVSAGTATGLARVVLYADPDVKVLPGEILVAPFTDPGWTPYFIPAAGIVMDQGGLLSHGSIVAREYGIPAVVNVGPATKLIKTGQMVQVDGDSGVVRIVATPGD